MYHVIKIKGCHKNTDHSLSIEFSILYGNFLRQGALTLSMMPNLRAHMLNFVQLSYLVPIFERTAVVV